MEDREYMMKIKHIIKNRKIMLAVVCITGIIFLMILLGSVFFIRAAVGRIHYEGEMTEIPWIDPLSAAGSGIYFPDGDPISQDGVINVLFLGTDFALTDGDRGRADSNMLCSLNTNTGDIRLISFERGIGVPVPGRGADLLTHAYSWGGSGLSQAIISQMFCLSINGYVQVDFGSFAAVIDTLGGVEVELTELEAKALNGAIPTNVWTWKEVFEGWNHLGGHDTLEYCRLRSIDSDWDRQRRQRTVLEQLQNKLRSYSKRDLLKMANTILPMIHTNLSRDDVLDILQNLPKLMRGSISQLQVPDKNFSEGYIRCIPEYESKKIANFIYDTGYELVSPY